VTHAALATKLVAAGKNIGHIAKAGTNDFHHYSYVTDADVLDKVRDALYEQGVASVVNVARVEHNFDVSPFFTTVQGEVTFIDSESGEELVTGFAGTGTDKGDKGYYKAVTGGVKYALLKTLLIPTGDDPEVDTAERKAAAPVVRNGSSPVPPAATKVTDGKISSAQVVKLKASLGDAGLKSDAQKLQFVSTILGHPISAKQMTSDQMDQVLAAIAEQPLVLAAAVELA